MDTVDPERLVLIHWDSLTGPLDQPMTGEVRIAGFLAAGAEDTKAFLQEKAAASPDLPFQTLPRFAPVSRHDTSLRTHPPRTDQRL